MKFTKLMALILVLVMVVSAFAACGGTKETETEAPVVNTETETEKQTETETETETETKAPCTHSREKEKEIVDKTCTKDGYIIWICRSCDAERTEVVPMSHEFTIELKSNDGAYTKQVCSVCAESQVVDASGAVVDASKAQFPFFKADFEGIVNFKEIALPFASDFEVTEEQFALTVKDTVENNTYVNVPTGNSETAPNGYFVITDKNSKLATGDFAISFDIKMSEYPKNSMALLTWKIGGVDYKLLTINDRGNILPLGTTDSAALTDKGWDNIKVAFDAETSNYYIYVNGVLTAMGTLGTSVAGKTGSSLKFYDGVDQFESVMDNISIEMIAEAKIADDQCIHKPVADTAKSVAPTCETAGTDVTKCERCGIELGIKEVKALGHKPGDAVVVEATCDKAGTSTAKCTVCSKDIVTELAAKGHTNVWNVAADGAVSTTCSVCNVVTNYKTDYSIFNFAFDDALETEKANNAKCSGVTQNGEIVADGDRKALAATGVNYIAYDAAIFDDVDLYTMSFDFKITADGPAGKFGSIITYTPLEGTSMKYQWILKTDNDAKRVGFQSAAGKNDDTNSVTFDNETWYSVFMIIDDNTGKAHVFINGTYIGSGRSAYPHTAANQTKYNTWKLRLHDGNVGSCLYDNFVVNKIVVG